MINFLNKPFLIGVAAVIVITVQAFMLRSAYNAGSESQLSKNRKVTIDQLKERSETNAEIRDLDIATVCEFLGGSMSDDGECL